MDKLVIAMYRVRPIQLQILEAPGTGVCVYAPEPALSRAGPWARLNPFFHPSLPSLSFPPLSPPLSSLQSPNCSWRSGERCKFLQWGYGTEPQAKLNLVHFSRKIWRLVAAIIMAFAGIYSPTCGSLSKNCGSSADRNIKLPPIICVPLRHHGMS